MNILLLITSILFGFANGDTLKQLLKEYNTESVPYIYVNQVKVKDNFHLLDSREPREFEVSHLKDAKFVGYNNFKLKTVLDLIPNKQDTIVVYCSLGVRSEDIGEKLKEAGYKNVYNLYGGIFEWKNQDNLVYDSNNKVTEEVHAFSKEWGKWLHKGVKYYE